MKFDNQISVIRINGPSTGEISACRCPVKRWQNKRSPDTTSGVAWYRLDTKIETGPYRTRLAVAPQRATSRPRRGGGEAAPAKPPRRAKNSRLRGGGQGRTSLKKSRPFSEEIPTFHPKKFRKTGCSPSFREISLCYSFVTNRRERLTFQGDNRYNHSTLEPEAGGMPYACPSHKDKEMAHPLTLGEREFSKEEIRT